MKCSICGCEKKKRNPPLNVMAEYMYGKGLEEHVCDNPRCARYGK
jgi:hypothetical protein